MNALQLRKIELEKEIKDFDQSQFVNLLNNMKYTLLSTADAESLKNFGKQCIFIGENFGSKEAELKGINLGLKVLEDYSQQISSTGREHKEIEVTNPATQYASCSADTQYQKGYQDAIKEVLDKIDKCKYYPMEVEDGFETRGISIDELKQQISEEKQ